MEINRFRPKLGHDLREIHTTEWRDHELKDTDSHIASNGVSAMAISGLWFASLYKSGLSLCNFSASDLSGWAWMDRAFPALSTFSNQGKFPPFTTLDSSVPSSNRLGPDGCVPSQISA